MSKIVTITLGASGGFPEAEGWVIVNYSDPRGGRTSIGAIMQRRGDGSMPTWDEVAALLLSNMQGRNEWPNEIQAKASANVLRLSIPDMMDVVEFSSEFNPTLDQSAPHELNPAFIAIAEESF